MKCKVIITNASTEEASMAAYGEYRYEHDCHYFEYLDGENQTVIAVSADIVTVNKFGTPEYTMTLIPDELTRFVMHTPYGDIGAGVHTNFIRIRKAGVNIAIDLDYSLHYNTEEPQHTLLKIKIFPLT